MGPWEYRNFLLQNNHFYLMKCYVEATFWYGVQADTT